MARSQSRCDPRYKAMASCADAPPCRRARSRSPPRSSRAVARTRTPRTPPRTPTRRRAPTTTRAARSPAEGRAAAGRGVRLVKVGDFDSPLYVTAPPGDRRRIFVVEQARADRRRARRQAASPSRSSTSARRSRPAASRACSRWPSPRTTRSRGCSTSTTPRRAGPRRSGSTAAPATTAPTPAARASCCAWTTPSPTTTAACMVFGPDKLMYVGTGDGGGGNDQHGARGNAQSLELAAGQDPADRSAGLGRPAVHDPVVEPVRRARGRPRRDLLLRAAQPVALLVRPRQRRPRHRRRRPGRGRGDRLRHEGRAGAATNFGWRPWEGRRRNFDEPAPGAVFPVITHTHQAGFCSITGGYVGRDRGVPGLYGRYVYGDYCNAHLRVATLHTGRVSSRTLSVPTISGVSSFGEDAAGRLYVTSLRRPGLPLRGALTARHGAGAPRRVGPRAGRRAARRRPPRGRAPRRRASGTTAASA